jgi:FKBP-type peptidyl-prolyl cis-trans isomerase SlyD
MEYLHGAENIVPGMERLLTGKGVGDRFSVTLPPQDAYGEYDDENVETISREDIPEAVEPGMEVLLEDEDGLMFEALVKEVTDESIVLDFNAPLAGKTVTYDVEVISMRAADAEELDHGHPHGYEDDLDDYDDDDEDDEDFQ